ncbi:MAG TPA: VCBS repeat-containing protein [Pyrinomonadaceae bacterium]|jgi:hypothetical protein|nr:VCBS repeat-containing protein [Pyrinomonadaceae bacterium]
MLGAKNHLVALLAVSFVLIAGGLGSIKAQNAIGVAQDAPLDYNGDHKTDFVVVRNTGGGPTGQLTWLIDSYKTAGTFGALPWGIATDSRVAGDFDGDDKADITVYRPGAESFFYTLRTADGTFLARQLGATGDDPSVVGDYDGDNIDDFAVYRSGANAGDPSFWYWLGSATVGGGLSSVHWGQNGDFVAPGDYDGDKKYDFCIQRNNGGGQARFWLLKSGGGIETLVWGTPTDVIVPGDYDGDGKTDFAVVRGSGGQLIWSVLGRNGDNIIHFGRQWGLSATDLVAQGDYDGDGKTDLAVWRPVAAAGQTSFHISRSGSAGAVQSVQWGQNGDYPVANFNRH